MVRFFGSRRGDRVRAVLAQATTLAFEGASDVEAVAKVTGAAAGDHRVLEEVLSLVGEDHTFPKSVWRRWLLLALERGPEPVPSQQLAQEAEQRDLLQMPTQEAFALLSAELPELNDMESDARAAAFDQPLSAKTNPDQMSKRRQQMRSARQILRRARRLVGPDAQTDDPLLGSFAAHSVVNRHLTRVMNMFEHQ